MSNLSVLVFLLPLLCDTRGEAKKELISGCTCQSLPGEESRKMPQLIVFRSQYWESREQMLKCAIAALWLAILTSSSTWNNNSHPERNIWWWLNALVLAQQEVIVVVFWLFFFRACRGLHPFLQVNPSICTVFIGSKDRNSK